MNATRHAATTIRQQTNLTFPPRPQRWRLLLAAMAASGAGVPHLGNRMVVPFTVAG